MLRKADRTTAIQANAARTVIQRLDRVGSVMCLAYEDNYGLATITTCPHYGYISWIETLRFNVLARLFSLEFLDLFDFLWQRPSGLKTFQIFKRHRFTPEELMRFTIY